MANYNLAASCIAFWLQLLHRQASDLAIVVVSTAGLHCVQQSFKRIVDIASPSIDGDEANVDDQITFVLFDLLSFHHGGHKLAKLASFPADEYAAADVSPVAIDRWWEW